MPSRTHAPERTCIACRRRAPQRALVRLAAVDGAVHVSLGPGAGRGAYVCPAPACLVAAARRRLSRALRVQVAVPPPEALAAMVRAAVERKVAALLGQGRRMGCVASGQEAVRERVARGAGALLILAVDGPAEGERLAGAAAAARIPVARALTREGLGAALGASPRWAAIIEDRHLAGGLMEYLAFLGVESASVGAPRRGESTRGGGVRGGSD